MEVMVVQESDAQNMIQGSNDNNCVVTGENVKHPSACQVECSVHLAVSLS
jgi:hypothetical protein